MIEIDMRVTAHSHGETDQKDAWFSVTLKGSSIALQEISDFKLTLKSEKESIFKSYPIMKVVSLKLHEPQRKLSEAPKP